MGTPNHLEELIRQLSALSPKERAEIFARVSTAPLGKPVSPDFKPPLIKGGTWVGGTLRREELYGDDGR